MLSSGFMRAANGKITFLLFAVMIFISLSLSAAEPPKQTKESKKADESSPFLGPPLLPQGDFEVWNQGEPEGWKLDKDKGECKSCGTVRASGKQSLQIQIPAGGGSVKLISPEIPAEPGQYLARFMMKVEGLSKSKSYEGGQAGMIIQWLGEQKGQLRLDYVAWSYIPMDFSYRDQIYQAPTGTAYFRVIVEIHGDDKVSMPSTAWFDDVSVCRYNPPAAIGENVVSEWSVTAGRNILKTPDATSWFYLAGVEGQESVQAKKVPDSKALLGYALFTKRLSPSGMIYHTAYTVEQPPGLYRVFFRVKIPPGQYENLTVPLVLIDVISSNMGMRGGKSLQASDFKKPGEYEDIWFDMVKPSTGWLAYRVSTAGNDVDSWLDTIRVVQLLKFRDPDLLAWYPGLASLDTSIAPKMKKKNRVLLVEGMLGENYRCAEAVQSNKGWEMTVIRTEMNMAGGAIPLFPLTWKELCDYNLVILANASMEALGPEQRYQLKKFIELGGGLLILGGKSAYGNGGILGSFMEEALPILPKDTRFDIVPNTKPVALEKAGKGIGLSLPANLVSPFIHQGTLRKGATVLAQIEKEPFMVSSTLGKGRIVCVLGTPYGIEPEGTIQFAEWKDLNKTMKTILLWLTQGGK